MTTFHTDTPLRIPHDATTLDGFRRWAFSADFPDRGRITYIEGELIIDMSPEGAEPHNLVKGAVTYGIEHLNRQGDLGVVFPDGVLLSNETARVSNEPDAMFASWQTLESGRLSYSSARRDDESKDMLGTPDWVLEVVSDSSVAKDTKRLRDAYHRAGITEYWIIDARGDAIDFELLHHHPGGYLAAQPDADGWRESKVFTRRFRLTRQRNRVKRWQYTLETAPV